MLVEHLVCPRSHARRNGEPESFGHHAVDDELVARRLLHREICRSGTLEDAVDKGGRALRDGEGMGTIGNQGAAGTWSTSQTRQGEMRGSLRSIASTRPDDR